MTRRKRCEKYLAPDPLIGQIWSLPIGQIWCLPRHVAMTTFTSKNKMYLSHVNDIRLTEVTPILVNYYIWEGGCVVRQMSVMVVDYCSEWIIVNSTELRQEYTGPTVGRLKRLKWLGRGWEQISVFSCVRSFQSQVDIVCSDSTCKVCGGWLLAIWAIGFSDWLCVSCMTILIGSVLANQRGVWEGWNTVRLCFSMHSVPSVSVFM